MNHMIPVSCVSGLLAQGLVVYPDEGGGMSYVVCETLLGRARVDGLGWQEAADLWVDLDNPNTRDRVLRAVFAEHVAVLNSAKHHGGIPYDPHPIACPVLRVDRDMVTIGSGEVAIPFATLPGDTDIDALAAVCRGPR